MPTWTTCPSHKGQQPRDWKDWTHPYPTLTLPAVVPQAAVFPQMKASHVQRHQLAGRQLPAHVRRVTRRCANHMTLQIPLPPQQMAERIIADAKCHRRFQGAPWGVTCHRTLTPPPRGSSPPHRLLWMASGTPRPPASQNSAPLGKHKGSSPSP